METVPVQTQDADHVTLADELNDFLNIRFDDSNLPNLVEWSARLVAWIKFDDTFLVWNRGLRGAARTTRLHALLQALVSRTPGQRIEVGRRILVLLAHTKAVDFFSQAGLPNAHGFFSELGERYVRRFLPSPPDHSQLAELCERLFDSEDDAAWIEALPENLLEKIAELLSESAQSTPGVWNHLLFAMCDALVLVAVEAAAVGLSNGFRQRNESADPLESPFFALLKNSETLSKGLRNNVNSAELEALKEPVQTDIANCRAVVEVVHNKLESAGVSVTLVFRLEKILAHLQRIEYLLILLRLQPTELQPRTIANFIAALVRGQREDRSTRALLRTNLNLLARKIVESASASGEHYITSTRKEYWHMLKSAGGGGLVTAFTTVFKFAITWAKAPLFFEGLFAFLNYSSSFIFMQVVGFKLATKQPSMTAAALAGKLGPHQSQRELGGFLEEVARITRSQFAAALGNIGMVIPAALVIDGLFFFISERHFLDAKTASYVIDSLNPFTSLTIVYAAFTGVLLWASSIASGWFENWSVYRRLPEAIAHNRRLIALVGRGPARGLSLVFGKHIFHAGGSLSLGFFLAMTPIFGKFFGLPLDVRHVTLSSGALAFAVSTQASANGFSLDILAAGLGIVVIGVLNFGVSFVCALVVALKAQGGDTGRLLLLAKAVGRHLVRSPGAFFLPPRNNASDSSVPPEPPPAALERG